MYCNIIRTLHTSHPGTQAPRPPGPLVSKEFKLCLTNIGGKILQVSFVLYNTIQYIYVVKVLRKKGYPPEVGLGKRKGGFILPSPIYVILI